MHRVRVYKWITQIKKKKMIKSTTACHLAYTEVLQPVIVNVNDMPASLFQIPSDSSQHFACARIFL